MEQLSFEAATPAAMETLLDFMGELYAHDRVPFDRERARRATLSLLDSRALGNIWLLRSGAAAIGYLVLTFGFSLEFGGRDALVDELFLVKAYRGQGFGKQALDFVFEKCREAGIQAVHLDVNLINEKAAAIYRHLGFKPLSRKRMTKWL